MAALAIAASLLSVAGGAAAVAGLGAPKIVALGPGEILSLAPARNGKIVAVGFSGSSMLVLQMDSDGRHRKRFSAGRGVANAVAVQADGKILVAGTTSANGTASLVGDMVLKRFTARGFRDRSFGSGGTVTLRGAVVNALALGPGNTIVAAGSEPGPDGSPRLAVARLRPNGRPDRTFGVGGFSQVDLGRYSEANAVAVQHDGSIVVAGDRSPGLRAVDALIVRLRPTGRVDASFGAGGVYLYLHPHGGAASSFASLVLTSGGKIIGGGGDVENSGQHALFVSLSSRGAPRWTLTTPSERFATTGENIGARALVVAAGGEILAAGKYLDSGIAFATVWAIGANGQLDQHQRSTGLIKTKLPGILGGEARGIAIASDGSVCTGGDLIGTVSRQALFVRYPPLR